jgi:hypothetical protein
MALQEGHSLKETLLGAWRAVIEPMTEETQILASPAELRVCLTREEVELLAEPEREGIYFQQEIPALRYYIEKDFPCAHPRASEALEPASETFSPTPEFEERKARG